MPKKEVIAHGIPVNQVLPVEYVQNHTVVSHQRGLSAGFKLFLCSLLIISALLIILVLIILEDPDYFIYKLRGYDDEDHANWDDLLRSQEFMLETFWNLPSTRMYGLGDHNLNLHFENAFYGGSVLDFVLDDEDHYEKANQLLHKIVNLDKTQIIGFYELNNILVNQTGFYDIFMDIEILAIKDPRSKISGKDTTAKLDHFENVNLEGEKLIFEDIKDHLNGFARIFISWSYGKNADGEFDPKVAEMNKLYTMSEGEIRNGQLNGYNRLINPTANWVSVGYFKNNVPYGKLIKYVNFQKFQEGIFQSREKEIKSGRKVQI